MTKVIDNGADVPRWAARIERIEVIDVLRGFALLGIFLVNIEWFSRPWQELGQDVPIDDGRLDHLVGWAIYLGGHGKFLTLFALLFGMSFAVMAMRAGERTPGFVAMSLRRSMALGVFGVAHAVLAWSGDILHAYALASLPLLLVRRWSERRQLLLGLMIYAGLCVWALIPHRSDWLGLVSDQPAQAAADIYMHGSWWQVTVQRGQDFLRLLPHDRTVVPLSFALFLCGAWLVRSGRIVEVHANTGFFLRVAVLGCVLGGMLTLMALYAGAAGGAVAMLGALMLACGYVGVIAFAFTTTWWYRPLSWLAPVGRMALSNYLLQSLVASTLFYGYGVGLWGKLGHAAQVALVLVIFMLQMVLSHWWLARFRYGPAEWIWRWFTYLRRPPLHVR